MQHNLLKHHHIGKWVIDSPEQIWGNAVDEEWLQVNVRIILYLMFSLSYLYLSTIKEWSV